VCEFHDMVDGRNKGSRVRMRDANQGPRFHGCACTHKIIHSYWSTIGIQPESYSLLTRLSPMEVDNVALLRRASCSI
jgi:hypothetical protein